MSLKNQNSGLPAVIETSSELSRIFSDITEKINRLLAGSSDPELNAVLMIMRNIGTGISSFLSMIKNILTGGRFGREQQFVAEYFFEHFSEVSQKTRASESIVNYALDRTEWLKGHSENIINSLKSIFAHLLSMKIDCSELYRYIYREELTIDINFDRYRKSATPDSAAAFTGNIDMYAIYDLLEINEGAGREKIKSAFRRLAKSIHPDLNPAADPKEFIKLEQAYKFALEKAKPRNYP